MLALTAFGGPPTHFSMFLDRLVRVRGYLTEEELIELNALCQIIPGPTSTQIITSIGFKIGGPNLAYLTLLVWILPAVTAMIGAAIIISALQAKDIPIGFTKFIQPMAVGFVSYAAYTISVKVIKTKLAVIIMVITATISFFVKNPYIFPIILLMAGAITAFKYHQQPREEKTGFKIRWANFILWAGVFILAAILGGITKDMHVLLFENFYRNGSLIFGGSSVLVPFMYTEFVLFKEHLTSEEFLTGFAAVQAIPGPVFSFTAYIGALAMREYGIWGTILGGFVAALGIFLPGTFLIFFVIRIWESLKKYRIIRASLEGISAASSGMVAAAAFVLFQPIETSVLNLGIVTTTFILLAFTRIPAPFIILAGLLSGLIAGIFA